MDLFDGAIDTNPGRWVDITEENVEKYDMVARSRLSPRAFWSGIGHARDAGYTPRMWIEGENGTTTTSEEGTR